MAGLVDIHSHLLPGIDDGPDELEGSLDMARAALDAGIATMAATPHLRSDFPAVMVEELGQRCQALRGALEREGLPLRVVSGAEVSLVWALEATEDQLRMASFDQGGSDLLVETPDEVSMLDRLLYALRSKGFRVTLAHPERSFQFQRAPAPLERLAEQGVLLQVNATSLLHRRSPPGRLAERLCREGLAQVLASDGHRGDRWRPVTALREAADTAQELFGPERAEWLTASAPAAIMEGQELPEGPPILERPRRRWFSRK